MKTNRKNYDDAFKLEIAKMMEDQGLSVIEIARPINVGRTAVVRWVAQKRLRKKG